MRVKILTLLVFLSSACVTAQQPSYPFSATTHVQLVRDTVWLQDSAKKLLADLDVALAEKKISKERFTIVKLNTRWQTHIMVMDGLFPMKVPIIQSHTGQNGVFLSGFFHIPSKDIMVAVFMNRTDKMGVEHFIRTALKYAG